MGSSCSSLDSVSSNECLKRLCSNESLSANDPFWNSLLGFSLVELDLVVMSTSNSKLLEDTISPLCKNLAINNVKTGNFHTQVVNFIKRMNQVIEHGVDETEGHVNPFTWQMLNSLFIIRNICKYFIQNLSEEVIIQQFLKPNSSGDGGVDSTISLFLSALAKGLLQLPVDQSTVLLHLEIVNTLITILAMVMYESQSVMNNFFYVEVMEGEFSTYSSALTDYLLTVFSLHDRLPRYIYKQEESTLSSTLWSVVTLGMGAGSQTDTRKVDLGTQSSLLLLILTNHPFMGNPYKDVLSSFLDGEMKVHVKPEALYNSLCTNLDTQHANLLLYKLLHENQVMKAFILSRTDVERLVEPLLKVLYRQDGDTSANHIYLTLITLLILTEDDSFTKDLFQIKLPTVKWYTDKHLTDVTLGDAFILVAIRVMHYNMNHTKDKYLHTNCLAMLANMSSKFVNLHPYVCQKLLAFFTTLAKRHNKTVEKLQLSTLSPDEGGEEGDVAARLSTDLNEIQEMLRMVFEVINSCLTHTVHLNANLVHVMLVQREQFEKFRELEQFKHLLQNVHTLLSQFHIKLEKDFGEQTRSVAQVLEVIETGLKTFRRGTFLKFPDLKFRYIEESDSSRFFVPYVWQIVVKTSSLHFKQTEFILT